MLHGREKIQDFEIFVPNSKMSKSVVPVQVFEGVQQSLKLILGI